MSLFFVSVIYVLKFNIMFSGVLVDIGLDAKTDLVLVMELR